MKPKQLLLTACAFLFSLSLNAADGDTTKVFVHDKVDMTWWGAYDQETVFPDGSETYRKILLHYTMGCSSSGCSDWDYTTKIELLHPTGSFDSTVMSVDTISVDPLEVDTTWNVFEVIDVFEMGRAITPYGGYMADGQNGFDNDWEHTYIYDVTDFAQLLQGTKTVRAFFAGWQNGFSVSLKFEFIEGTPPRNVVKIENLYRSGPGGWSYTNPTNFENERMPQRDVQLGADAVSTKLRVTPTGHGFVNSLNAAEFYPRDYYVSMNGAIVYTQDFFDFTCGWNPVFPQGGTWVYDRCNWCPGTRAQIFEHELTTAPGSLVSLDLDIQTYTVTVPSGETPPTYIMDVQLVSYGPINFTTDAAIIDILAPTTKDENARFNPICGQPEIVIRNEGATPLTSLTITYGVVGGNTCDFDWAGNLAFMEEAEVSLPPFSWAGFNSSNPEFMVSISSPNNGSDEYAANNEMTSSFEVPDMLIGDFIFEFGTNNVGSETNYNLRDAEDNLIYASPPFLASNTNFKDTFHLAPGCYKLQFNDTDGDGLSWWANNDGGGYVRIRREDVPFYIKSWEPDFGSGIYYEFTVGAFEDLPGSGACPITSVETLPEEFNNLEILPNPNSGVFHASLKLEHSMDVEYSVFDAVGKVLLSDKIGSVKEATLNIDLMGVSAGIYFLHVNTADGVLVRKFVVNH